MISQNFLAKLSSILCIIMSEVKGMRQDAPFGRLNIIMSGDFHQFPPVGEGSMAPLYWPASIRDHPEAALRSKLFAQFRTVIILKEQKRVTDPEWICLLRCSQTGTCDKKDLSMLKSLVLSSKNCPQTDFRGSCWEEAWLVTPWHGVCKEWNKAALEEHCRKTKWPLISCEAEDTIKGCTLSLEEKWSQALQTKESKQKTNAVLDGTKLPDSVHLIIGAKVMVTSNINTDMKIANGTHGKIIVDPGEPEQGKWEARTDLQYPPSCILIRLEYGSEEQASVLPEGVVPIFPEEQTYQLCLQGGKSKKVK